MTLLQYQQENAKHPMQKHKDEHPTQKHETQNLHINQRDQQVTGADLGRPFNTQVAEMVWLSRLRAHNPPTFAVTKISRRTQNCSVKRDQWVTGADLGR